MIQARTNHAATVLDNGRVLLTGGLTATDPYTRLPTNTAELFLPDRNVFAATAGAMTDSRERHTSTLLDDGRVLVGGGANASGTTLDVAEIHYPVSNTFAPTTKLITARRHHAAVRLPNGDVLIAGGNDPSGDILNSTEIFHWDAQTATGSFAQGPEMVFDRTGHTATATIDGLIIGGWSFRDSYGPNAAITASVEQYDYVLRQIDSAPSLSTNRTGHMALALLDVPGGVLVAGGLTTGEEPTSSAELVPEGVSGNMLVNRIEHGMVGPIMTLLGESIYFWAIGGETTFRGNRTAATELIAIVEPNQSTQSYPQQDLPFRALVTRPTCWRESCSSMAAFL
jgi:Galactose oxidase, central domain